MCEQTRQNMERMKDIEHVKILVRYSSGLSNCSYGIYLERGYYRIEPTSTRQYVCITTKINGEWQV